MGGDLNVNFKSLPPPPPPGHLCRVSGWEIVAVARALFVLKRFLLPVQFRMYEIDIRNVRFSCLLLVEYPNNAMTFVTCAI